ncbi:enoyl-CoA hydratase/isomerase family protein [Pyxidicoccus parkwayensis]|uniref:Enoyl-CoA hydratase/isomerase family protein n=1 Tax=Pyxidicoccus parkwayensis TaxID=2813578 RepID=A0ABX7PBH6_9BACT|nr:enoyl-CoA hydratase-related protein [Pyxidicoccus parkwaysis]QSQ27748.1 enoyl-CoA hydratase/isomerase family protein [Pyxidicoccus parkwaysis]
MEVVGEAAGEVRYEVQGAQAHLTIDRPKARNALSPAVVRGLISGLERAEADAAVRVVVLTGAGEKVFCAGGDLGQMAGDEGFLATHEGRRSYGKLLSRFQEARKPTVARVNGHALAGGLGLVLACDLAVAVEGADFGTPEIDVGLFPMMMMALLQRHVGRKRALELVLTGDRLPAREALALGLVNRVVPAAELDAAVGALAGKLAGKSQAVMALGRRAFFTAEDMPLPAALEYLASQLSLNVLADDAGEGISAFLEKRPPKWNDR